MDETVTKLGRTPTAGTDAPSFTRQSPHWFDGLSHQQRETLAIFKENLYKRYRPHEVTRWLHLHQFADCKQQPHESVDDYFQAMTRHSQQLGKTTKDIIALTIVAGLLLAISRFVMTRNPKTIDQALDFAQTARVLEQDSSDNRVGVALASLTDQIGTLQIDLNRIQNSMRSLVQNRAVRLATPGQPCEHQLVLTSYCQTEDRISCQRLSLRFPKYFRSLGCTQVVTILKPMLHANGQILQ